MPTYDYQCDGCGHRFEEFQSMKADPLKICPACKHDTLRRLIGGGAGLIFKGNGFYITDYKNNGNGHSKKTTNENAKESTGKKDSSKDTKANSSSGESKKDTAA